MSLKSRVIKLENIIAPEDLFRAIYVPDDADCEYERERYRAETGYTGEVLAIHENDPVLGRDAIAELVEQYRQANG